MTVSTVVTCPDIVQFTLTQSSLEEPMKQLPAWLTGTQPSFKGDTWLKKTRFLAEDIFTFAH